MILSVYIMDNYCTFLNFCLLCSRKLVNIIPIIGHKGAGAYIRILKILGIFYLKNMSRVKAPGAYKLFWSSASSSRSFLM